jgi:hypothetical protein
MARYRVQVWISTDSGDLSGQVYVDADSREEAQAEAAELVKESAIDTMAELVED